MNQLSHRAWASAMLLSCSVAHAAGNPIVARGVERYAQGDYQGAVKLLEPALAGGIKGPGEKDRARTYLAAAYFAQGDVVAARRTLEVLLREQPWAEVDSTAFPPPFVELFAQVKREAAAPPAGEPPAPPSAPESPKVEQEVPAEEPSTSGVSFGLYAGAAADPAARVVGGEVALALDLGPRWNLRLGGTIARYPAGRFSLAYRLPVGERLALSVGPRLLAAPFPGGMVMGGGLGAHLVVRLAKPVNLLAGAAGEVYSSPQGRVVAPLLNLGIEAHLGR
ncbi:MAG: tetratricopeptide repeat protein [Myxococcales bacterium]|nr:tetratricopeptide repeat protein [Myxococcales bacterium]